MKANGLIVFMVIVLAIISCKESPENEYIRLQEAELASGIRYDSLFEGLYFSMERQEFMNYCYQMNLQGKFKQGGIKNSSWVECALENEMKHPAVINFFPKFTHERITEMQAAVYYNNTTYENKIFNNDSLLHDVLNMMENWYGGPEFIKIKSPYFFKDDVFVKVNGNRRITVYEDQSGQMINLWYVDLLAQDGAENKN